jgi:hypothetical protein
MLQVQRGYLVFVLLQVVVSPLVTLVEQVEVGQDTSTHQGR